MAHCVKGLRAIVVTRVGVLSRQTGTPVIPALGRRRRQELPGACEPVRIAAFLSSGFKCIRWRATKKEGKVSDINLWVSIGTDVNASHPPAASADVYTCICIHTTHVPK